LADLAVTDWRRKISFLSVGAVGFIFDFSAFTALLWMMPTSVYATRIIAFCGAVFVTWRLNRRFTFKRTGSGGLLAELAAYFAASGLSGGLNISTYSAIVYLAGQTWFALYAAMVAGTLVGLVSNYLLYTRAVFR
jgi:putative flippase GtrA